MYLANECLTSEETGCVEFGIYLANKCPTPEETGCVESGKYLANGCPTPEETGCVESGKVAGANGCHSTEEEFEEEVGVEFGKEAG